MPPIDLILNGSEGVLRLVPWKVPEVREGGRYLYRLVGTARTLASIEPSELFSAQPDDPSVGDFTPRECVGQIGIVLSFDDGSEATTTVEVLPTKLEYETEYRAMLEQIADQAAEAVLQGFAPASLQAHADSAAEASTRYRSLAFLAARFRDETFRSAMERIRHQPHHDWKHHVERRPIGAGLRTGSSVARQMLRGPSTAATPHHLAHLSVPSLPSVIDHGRTEASYDTAPNRFVRYAFSRWQGIALEVLDTLDDAGRMGAGPVKRGRREAQWIVDQCEDMLHVPALRESSGLAALPTDNHVLLRTPGYRDVLRAFALTEATMALEAVLPDDPFSATQRNVATLYEYWCFIAMAGSLSSIGGGGPRGLVFERSANGMSLALRQGKESRLSWELLVEGRVLIADLWFNRTFIRTQDPRMEAGSWARQLRPDVSLRLRPKSARPTDAADPELDVWLHFDAKYRIDRIVLDEAIEGEESARPERAAKREDLLKMHAYRDAIRRSAGAYVLYPGDGSDALTTEFHEILPGIGAFPLRPLPGGDCDGARALEEFIREVARHVANQASAMERTQYWTTRYNRRKGRRIRPVDFLSKPPADTLVAVGYVRADQLGWIRRTKQYNVRVGDRRGAVDIDDDLLAAEIVVLWTRAAAGAVELIGAFERNGPWRVATTEDLARTGYPPRDRTGRYLVSPIEPLSVAVERLVDPSAIGAHTSGDVGAPWSTTWAALTATDESGSA